MGTQFCSECGSQLEKDSKFCGSCGAKIADTTEKLVTSDTGGGIPPTPKGGQSVGSSREATSRYKNIRDSLPAELKGRLVEGEKVFYYLTGGGGCLGGPRTFLLLTDSRVILQSIEKEKGGCIEIGLFGFQTTTSTEIPLEHVSSVSFVATSGCLSPGNQVVVRSGSGEQYVRVENPQLAQETVKALHELIRERKAK